MIRTWLVALIRRQPARLVGPAIGITIAVALLASLGAFLAQAKSSMTARAGRSVAVDWQVQVSASADPAAVATVVTGSQSVTSTELVGFAKVPGMAAADTAGAVTVANGVVLGISDTYRTAFPGEIRVLTGTSTGVLVAQQTAANLHAAPGTQIELQRTGLPSVMVTVDGIVDLPQANSLFQTVGAPTGAQPTAPPDNVVLLPYSQWLAFSAPSRLATQDTVTTQIHARLDHRSLPTDPAAAYATAIAAAHNVEARTSGAATVGNNLAATLDAARGDASYAQILFLFLGLPGAVLAGLLTATVAAAGAGRRRSEQALLRIRGASRRELLALVCAEAATIGLAGCAAGLCVAALTGAVVFGSASFGATTGSALLWCGLAVALGLAITATAIIVPAARSIRYETASTGRQQITSLRYPWWARYGLDAAALLCAGLLLVATSRNGYQLVLAPEGVPTVSVSYWALAGPALLWLGAALLVWRLVDLLAGRGRVIVGWLLRPFDRRLAPTLAAGISRQRRPLVRAAVLLALAVAFAISTATFNATYQAQAEADAQLTNGANVTVTEPPGTDVPASYARTLEQIPGVRAVEPIQHRYAYVGSDLQDLFGVNPQSIRSVTALQDSYFVGASAAALMSTLQQQPNSILVSAETVKDYQLRIGDALNLRLVDGRSGQQLEVAFRYVGIVAEFPTAPKDSFFIANSEYVAQQTNSAATGSFLIDTGSADPAIVAARVRSLVGSGVSVTDIGSVRGQVGSSLTSVDLSGLTKVELSFALLLGAANSGLVLALGLAERRRMLAIMTALGARRRHRLAAVAGQTILVGLTGILAGIALGVVLSYTLVKVLTGVFDPPPTGLAFPGAYLALVGVLTLGCLVVVTVVTQRVTERSLLPTIRSL